ncbi:MAG: DUF4476 domain-containing protein [Flavobacteriales bacterium]|nr:DUF4476 domain-containing protein [Flavobacteriales bacterium]
MKQFSTLALSLLLAAPAAIAQTDLVFFSDDGMKFTLIVDGEIKNPAPASRVVATGIRNETPMCVIRFEDKTIADVKQSGWFPAGKEYTIVVTTNKKGVRVLRPQGEAALGTAASAEPVKPKPETFQEDAPVQTTQTLTTQSEVTGVNQTIGVGGVQQTTSVTVTEEETGDGMGENVNFSMGVNGVGINMNVGVTEGGSNSSTTTTTTTRTTTTRSSTTAVQEPVIEEKPVRVAEPYRMPGYTGAIGCAMPMSTSEFAEIKTSIESKGFEETKMTMAKQIGRDRCFSSDQVKGIMGLFGFEETKLEFAKFAYDRTHDIGNYYRVNDAFGFESSIEELNTYIQSR